MKKFHLVLVAILACLGADLRAETKRFMIDPAQSELTLSGNFSGFNVNQQGPGSLTTSYSGIVQAEVTDSTIQFLSGSTISAADSGNWQPAPGGAPGFAPANYGGQAVIAVIVARAALRNIQFEIASPPIALGPESFPADEIEFTFPEDSTAALDYNTGQEVGTVPLVGATTNSVITSASTSTTLDGLMRIVIPVDYEFELTGDRPGFFRFVGTIVANEIRPLLIEEFEVSEDQLVFTFDTTPGKTYRIFGTTELPDFSIQLDQFTASETPTTRMIERIPANGNFFILSVE